MRRLILASASPSRRWLLESAGLAPEVMVSNVDEGGVEHLAPLEAVVVLARRKGEAVAARLGPEDEGPIVVACDSMLEFEGEAWSKAGTPAEVVMRWQRLRGRAGQLHTGHFVSDLAARQSVTAADTALVRFGHPTDREIEAYSRTAEALEVAGPFTLEGRSAPWIDSIEGSFGTITGLSLPLLRHLLAQLDIQLVDLWS